MGSNQYHDNEGIVNAITGHRPDTSPQPAEDPRRDTATPPSPWHPADCL